MFVTSGEWQVGGVLLNKVQSCKSSACTFLLGGGGRWMHLGGLRRLTMRTERGIRFATARFAQVLRNDATP